MSKEGHARNTYYVEQLNQISERTGDAKYTVHFLSNKADVDIPVKQLAHPKGRSLKLKDQVNAWLGEISPGVTAVIKENSEVNSFSLRFSYEMDYGETNEYKPENVGFGVSYVLPLLVAILSAPSGSLLILENPESHLHPAGQAAVGKLLCDAAQNGIQLVVETHSDHIINASIISVIEKSKNNNIGIENNFLKIYFIDRQDGKVETKTEQIKVTEIGRIEKAPKNFFDQFSKDLKKIMGF